MLSSIGVDGIMGGTGSGWRGTLTERRVGVGMFSSSGDRACLSLDAYGAEATIFWWMDFMRASSLVNRLGTARFLAWVFSIMFLICWMRCSTNEALEGEAAEVLDSIDASRKAWIVSPFFRTGCFLIKGHDSSRRGVTVHEETHPCNKNGRFLFLFSDFKKKTATTCERFKKRHSKKLSTRYLSMAVIGPLFDIVHPELLAFERCRSASLQFFLN